MTLDKAMFIFLSGIFIMIFLVISMVGKLFFLKNLAVALVAYQIGLLIYAVMQTIIDSWSLEKNNRT